MQMDASTVAEVYLAGLLTVRRVPLGTPLRLLGPSGEILADGGTVFELGPAVASLPHPTRCTVAVDGSTAVISCEDIDAWELSREAAPLARHMLDLLARRRAGATAGSLVAIRSPYASWVEPFQMFLDLLYRYDWRSFAYSFDEAEEGDPREIVSVLTLHH